MDRFMEAEREEQKIAMSSYLNSSDAYIHRYLRYSEIINFVKEMKSRYPEYVRDEIIGKSFEHRDIIMVKISNNFNNCKKVTFLESGMHAREWIAPSLALHCIKQVLEEQQLLIDSDWHIIPISNPDGYEYSFYDRLWRKTRSLHRKSNCVGVDLNRNFDLHFGQISSNNPCANTFHGTGPFSEPESRAIWSAVSKVKNRVKTYISLHSFGNQLMYPYSYSRKLPFDWIELERCGLKAKEAVLLNRGSYFRVGSIAGLLYFSSGSVTDFMKKKMLVPFVYVVELDEGPEVRGFHVIPSHIKYVVNETFPLIKTLSQCSPR